MCYASNTLHTDTTHKLYVIVFICYYVFQSYIWPSLGRKIQVQQEKCYSRGLHFTVILLILATFPLCPLICWWEKLGLLNRFGQQHPIGLVISNTVHTNTKHELYTLVFIFYYMFWSHISQKYGWPLYNLRSQVWMHMSEHP